jgi:hypothetical protein
MYKILYFLYTANFAAIISELAFHITQKVHEKILITDTRLIHWDEDTGCYLHQSLQYKYCGWASECTPDISKFLNFSIRKRNGIHCAGTNASSWKFIPAHMVTKTHRTDYKSESSLNVVVSIILKIVTVAFCSEEPVTNVSVQDGNHSTLTKQRNLVSAVLQHRRHFRVTKNFNPSNSNNHWN